MTTPVAVDMVVICYIKKRDYIRNKAEMKGERALTTSEYGATFLLFSPPPLPFTTELANELASESDSQVTGELVLVFIHGISTWCTLNFGVSSWCMPSLLLAPVLQAKRPWSLSEVYLDRSQHQDC